ncbi:hypothetical protein Ahy_A08g038823 [Arachis hypogaea]|uniref:Uncharacterized protein n=1 Tax=Arachis hypogaea TaxID=3818 RepID=A0A445BUF9_ARAHY|nr:hypothetical protein Ahy_A08g038823 [Arachis hypogaea]
MIRKIYDYWIARRLQQIMQDVREERDELTIWIRPDIKRALHNHFSNDEGFRRHHLTNRANRALPILSKYIGGLATFMKMKSRMSKSLEHEAILVETFEYTHTLKPRKEGFANERSAAHYVRFSINSKFEILETVTQQSQPGDDLNSDASVVNPDRVWRDSASEPYKNLIYLQVGVILRQRSLHLYIGANPEKVVDLREQVQKLTQELNQQAQQSDERYNEFLAHVGATDSLWLQLREDLERLERLRD